MMVVVVVVVVVIIMNVYCHTYWNLFPWGQSNQGMKLTYQYEELCLHNRTCQYGMVLNYASGQHHLFFLHYIT
jgi:hypothetical protein